MSSRLRAAVGSALFFVVAPGLVAGVVPWWLSGWRPRPPFLHLEGTRWLGGVIGLAGFMLLVDAFVRFVREGRGTPAPVAPPRRLVVSGSYRRTRNPMYLGVLGVVVGQSLLLASVDLLVYSAAIAVAFHVFVALYEEPTLHARYGRQYDAYRGEVPRWGLRLRAWRPG